ncbi:uroporphyrinogen-III synthase [Granulicella mallensis]|uniref:ANTAR domain-containing protein n=1 Tax=Granulicella mallensis (strain ATCC BAA-1857 / DSM 23137 / MP5ACTX8) TaxID=682795 RepID=G8NTK8_GRAMM|nr:uroporphyrinogen-III synthase [Granulicella mallensis]AEU35240.1 ANTAR domain protein with unknown sensor [Granulicella mallensis MP5ACTX8]
MAHASFNGLRVLALESRRAKEVEKLILTYGGEPIVVPAMREVGLESNQHVLDFAAHLLEGRFDLLIFMTGVGVRAMLEIVQTRYDREDFLAALRKIKIAVRGAKPNSALRELKINADVVSEEPSTWHELLQAIDAAYGDALGDMRVAVQEYGASNPELLAELSSRTRELTKVPVYQWALPEDLQPLRECVLGILSGSVDVVLFMTAVQAIHLFRVAEQMGVRNELREALGKAVVVSIGPTTSEELTHYGLEPDFEPSRPKMGFMVNEAAQYSSGLLVKKRNGEMEAVASQPATEGETAPAKRVRRVAVSTPTMAGFRDGLAEMDFLHEISSRIAAADSLHLVLDRIVDFISGVIPCDSCFIYVLEGEQLMLRASKNPHAELIDHIGVQVGQGVTGWVAKHRQPVAIASAASNDPRFKAFKNIPEDHFEAMLCTPILCAGRVVGVINLQHRMTYRHTTEQVRLLSTLGFLVGAEIERARLESENMQLTGRLETRKAVDRAKSVLQRDLSLNEEEAYQMMQRESRQRRKSMREIAEAILLAEDFRRSTG